MSEWEDFENYIAKELGLSRVPGSGNQWHSKLDVKGKGTRWSLKSTKEGGLSLSRVTLAEAILSCGGIGGTGEIPLWANRVEGLGDFVTMRFEDWRSLLQGELKFEEESTKAQERRRRAKTPQLMRGNHGSQ